MGPREIHVLRALALGDLLVAVPFLRALRARHPEARISLIGLPWASAFVARFDRYLDALVPFPGWRGVPEVPFDPERSARFVAAARLRPVDLAIQAHGSGRSVNAFVAALGAAESAGFFPADDPAARPPHGAWIPYPTDVPEIHRLLRLAARLGVDSGDDRLEWPIRSDDRDQLAAAVAPERLEPGRYAVVHPGASRPIARWPTGRFAAVADALAARGLRVVLTGAGSEAPITDAVRYAMRADGLDLAGRTTLDALGALLADARVVVANDTGVAHLAEAVDTPTVRIFRASDPRRWGPLRRDRHVALVPEDLGRACVDAGSPGHPDCAAAACVARGADPAPSRTLVPVPAAVAAVDRLLEAPDDRVA